MPLSQAKETAGVAVSLRDLSPTIQAMFETAPLSRLFHTILTKGKEKGRGGGGESFLHKEFGQSISEGKKSIFFCISEREKPPS